MAITKEQLERVAKSLRNEEQDTYIKSGGQSLPFVYDPKRAEQAVSMLMSQVQQALMERDEARRELAEAMTHGEHLSEVVLQFDKISPTLQEAISFFSFQDIKVPEEKP